MGKLCVACLNEKNGIKTIMPHSCGKVNIVSIGRDEGKGVDIEKIMNSLEIANKMKRCYTAIKGVYRDEFQQVIEPHKQAIQKCMNENKISEVEACLKLSQECAEAEPNRVVFLMAATIEIVEHEN